MRLPAVERLRNKDRGGSTSATLLDALCTAHDQVLAAMAVLASITVGPLGDQSSFTNARWRLSQSSVTRRALWIRIFRHLLPLVSAKEVADLALLQSADEELHRHSSNHVAIWTTATIQDDWNGYCEASRLIRARMEACLAAERRILLPMLERDARRS